MTSEIVAMQEALTDAQEAQAQELAQALEGLAREELQAIARLLVRAAPEDLFGDTEFKVRDLIHRVAAAAFERHLASKKTATTAPA
jgi:hypothetical protein